MSLGKRVLRFDIIDPAINVGEESTVEQPSKLESAA